MRKTNAAHSCCAKPNRLGEGFKVFILLFLTCSYSFFAQVDAPFYYMDFNQWHAEDANGCPQIDPIVGCEFYDWSEELGNFV